MKAFEIIVSGIVQGVAFRHFTKIESDRLGVSGTVQNNKNGTVNIFVEGEEERVMKFIEWCHRGPDSATVSSIEYREVIPKKLSSFEIIR